MAKTVKKTKPKVLKKTEGEKPKKVFAESELQQTCVKWFRLQYKKYLLLSIPNGAVLRGDKAERAIQMSILKAEGLYVGAADLLLLLPKGKFHGLFVEMKTKIGVQSEYQKKFEKIVVEQGYGYAIARTFDDFQRIIESYIKHGTY